jgi:CheY-like chemotaxis protein
LCIPNATGSLVEDFEEIRRLCDRGADLTRQLLAFSRRSVVAPSAVDLNRVVTETKRLLGRLLGEHIELTALLDPHVRCIRAEPSQVQQVIVNLAVNARDAMPLGGKLTIQTQVLNDPEEIARMVEKPSGPCYVMLAVSDTGQGISPEVRDRIFEPFFTTKPHGQGTGLGLATVYGIVKQSGGEISVQSKAGQGTTFHILFPVAVDGVEAVTPITSATEDSGGSETILVVEDDHLLRSLIRRILISRGYSVVAARNGAEALDVAANHPEPIQALVTDVIMPQMGGWELAQRLAMVTPDLRVLFISGYTTTEFSIERTVGAATAFIQKPFKPAELAGKVRAILDASKSA